MKSISDDFLRQRYNDILLRRVSDDSGTQSEVIPMEIQAKAKLRVFSLRNRDLIDFSLSVLSNHYDMSGIIGETQINDIFEDLANSDPERSSCDLFCLSCLASESKTIASMIEPAVDIILAYTRLKTTSASAVALIGALTSHNSSMYTVTQRMDQQTILESPILRYLVSKNIPAMDEFTDILLQYSLAHIKEECSFDCISLLLPKTNLQHEDILTIEFYMSVISIMQKHPEKQPTGASIILFGLESSPDLFTENFVEMGYVSQLILMYTRSNSKNSKKEIIELLMSILRVLPETITQFYEFLSTLADTFDSEPYAIKEDLCRFVSFLEERFPELISVHPSYTALKSAMTIS